MNDITVEIWRAIPGYVGLYEVSNLGRVMSLPRPTASGGIMKDQRSAHGYRQVILTKSGKQRGFYVHRLLLLAFIGPCPEGLEVRHLDGNNQNNTLGNLAYSTHLENIRDKRIHGTDHQRRKTHCPQGHEYTAENTRLSKGFRYCKQCARDYEAKRRASGKTEAA